MVLQLLVSGLALGSIYALLALSLVLIHKATDVVNFGQGEMSMFSVFIAFFMLDVLGLPLIVVFLLGFPLGALLGAAVEYLFIRPLHGDPPVNLLIVAIGLFIVFNNLAGWIWGFDPYKFPSLFPTETVDIGGVRASPNSLGVIGISIAIMGVLYLFFEHTREGIAMRAASMNAHAARLMGIRVARVSLMAWALASGIGTLTGLLVAPLLFLDFEMMITVLIKAFAGAILGGFNSLPGAVVGGLAIGVIEIFFAGFVSTQFKDSFAFLIIIGVLMFRPTGLFSLRGTKKV